MPPTALVRPVSPRVAEGQVTFLQRRPVDLARAREQHAAYVDLLRELGRDVVELPAADDLPDAVFVEDAVVVVDDLAVLTRPGAASRAAEPATVEPVVRALGLRVERLTEPATLDGGDVLQVGDQVFVGLGSRTNAAGAQQLADLLAPLGRTVTTVAVTGCLHLKTGATALPDGTVLAVPDWLDLHPFAGLTVVPAPEQQGADVLLVDGTVVVSAAAPHTADLVRELGHPVRTVEIDELEKLECGPTCLSVLLDAPLTNS